MKLKQLREPKPSKISFRTVCYSKKAKNEVFINILEDDEKNGITMFTTMTGESYKENLCMVLLEQEPKVLEYLHQAVPRDKNGDFKPLEYERQDKVIQRWIPDMAVIWEHRSKPWIIEVKPMNYILENEEKLLHKWIETEKYANENNWDFHIFTDAFTTRRFRLNC